MVVEEFFGLVRQIADQFRLLAGFHVHGLDLFNGLLPVVTEAHLAGRLFHLGFAPRVLFVRDGDELFRRVGNHLIGEFHHEAFAADGIADDVVRGAGPRGGYGSRIGSAATGIAAATTASASARRRSCDRAWIGSAQPRHAIPQESRISLQGSVRRPVALFRPPGEDGVVGVVKREPGTQRVAQRHGFQSYTIPDDSPHADGFRTVIAPESGFHRLAGGLDLPVQIGQRVGDLSRVHRPHLAARFFQIDDGIRERQVDRVFRFLFGIQIEPLQVVIQAVAEQDVIDFAVLAHGVEVLFRQGCLRVQVKAAEPFAPLTGRPNVVIPLQVAPIGDKPLDQGANFALRRIEIGEIARGARGRDGLE